MDKTGEIVHIAGVKFLRLPDGELEYVWPEGPGDITVRSRPDGIHEIPELADNVDTSRWGVGEFYKASKELLGR